MTTHLGRYVNTCSGNVRKWAGACGYICIYTCALVVRNKCTYANTHTHNMCSVSIIYRPFRPDGSIWEVVQTNRGFPALPVFGNFHRESGDYLTVGFGVPGRGPACWANPGLMNHIELLYPNTAD